MNTYRITIDVPVEVWDRREVEIKAESENDALETAKSGAGNIISSNYLFETEKSFDEKQEIQKIEKF